MEGVEVASGLINMLLVVGSVMLLGTLAGSVFQKLRLLLIMGYIPVLNSAESVTVVGQLEFKKLMDRIAKEVIFKQQEIEE